MIKTPYAAVAVADAGGHAAPQERNDSRAGFLQDEMVAWKYRVYTSANLRIEMGLRRSIF